MHPPNSIIKYYYMITTSLKRYMKASTIRREGDTSLHTARFYEQYNRSPEVDLSVIQIMARPSDNIE
jgi:hypothetical protein